ncbi:MAG: hypothetical protein RLN90_08660 [Balneolaceae bacterium]
MSDKEESNKPSASVEVDGKVIFEIELDEDNADWIRAARRNREVDSKENN